ncbi:outer membrane protein assembly factor BamD [Thiomicrorhabdus lithotrophica]|uniref:Outer membrane protein assembly factor BamD n=1 Tax=Thiomicrorhabdus lithotrophica TaxID=2949997 RepID=A0ABY8C6U0_9GAMM|nr:outer membrane protein assembly factor BamD [Thiomicrorhabdus lithotrophica]WEJ61686.1 outer membrane protein assembly factor BamD [Thiomicrorhabdus lithotrophica]
MKKTLLSLMLVSGLGLQGCSTLNGLIEKPDDEKTVEEFYADATEGFQDQQWDTAIQNYEKLKAYFPYGRYAEQTHLELAYAYYKYDEPESAILELDEFIRLFPKHKQLAYAYYLKGLAADSIIRSWLDNYLTDPATRDVKSAKRAYNYYSELLNRFPESKYAVVASKRLVILRNQMARHELKVAQFYFNKEAYLASANRAKYILENYPQASSTVKALAMIEKSYGKLGMTEAQADASKVYELNKDATENATDVSFEATAKNDNNSTEKPKKDDSWWSSITGMFD